MKASKTQNIILDFTTDEVEKFNLLDNSNLNEIIEKYLTTQCYMIHYELDTIDITYEILSNMYIEGKGLIIDVRYTSSVQSDLKHTEGRYNVLRSRIKIKCK
jgi:hypothetical protein